MIYLLDTNAWSHLARRTSKPLFHRFRETPADQIILSAIAWFELQYGVALAGAAGKQHVETVLSTLAAQNRIIPFDDDAAAAAAGVRASLKTAGTPIGAYDVLLAGHALALGAVLVTNNTREFKRVKGLRLEDWTATGER